MAATCGQAATVEGAQLFISPYRSRSRCHRPWLPETILRSVTFGSRQERDRRYMRLQWSKMACAQFDDWGVVYSENGAFATTSAKLGDVYPSTYRTPKSRTMLSKVDSGFRRTMLQRHSLSPFLSARRGNSARISHCLSCGIRSRPAPRTSAVIPEWVIATSGSL